MQSPLTVVRYDLDGQDPYRNLAAEEFLARTCPEDTVRLVFSCNGPAVVLGRNQNPWIEADLGDVARRGLAVARRASGGGTVVHDLGNLNYGLAMPRQRYAPGTILALVVQALVALGIPAAACARHSIWVTGRKVSGTAFLLTGRTALLHGCILVDSDLDRLRRVLRPPTADRRSHAVTSVRSPVTRLRDVRPGVTVGDVREALAEVTSRSFGGACRRGAIGEAMTEERLAIQAEHLRSWDWIYGRTPDFEHVLHADTAPVVLRVKGARIAGVEAGETLAAAASLWTAWEGLPYDGDLLAAAAEHTTDLDPRLRAALVAALRREVPPVAGHGAPPTRACQPGP